MERYSRPKRASVSVRGKTVLILRRCNLCSNKFRQHTVFDRFCESCRQNNERFKFSEWLPNLDADLAEKVAAA